MDYSAYKQIDLRRKFWKLVGAQIDLTASDSQQPLGTIKMKVWKLREDIRLFALRRKGLKSTFVRDSWEIKDVAGQVIGTVRETSGILALAWRWLEIPPFGEFIGLLFSFVPQSYTISLGDTVVGTIVHCKNPFIVKMHLDTSTALPNADLRLPLSVAALLNVVGAAKNN